MLPSTFRQIEVFLAVVEAGSFAGAAAKLSITSASVSNHIKALERQMGQELFVRQRGRRVVLAEAGLDPTNPDTDGDADRGGRGTARRGAGHRSRHPVTRTRCVA